MTPYETFKQGNMTVHIYPDRDAESPDEWGSEDLFLIATHRQFEVKWGNFACDQFTPERYKLDYHVLPLYAYIHGGVALSLGNGSYPFNDQWDSGQVGWVLVKKRCGFRNIRKAAQSLVEEWNTYLSGDVWGYEIEDECGDAIASCWGYYGLEYCQQCAREQAKSLDRQLLMFEQEK